jgi:hypothetical protein
VNASITGSSTGDTVGALFTPSLTYTTGGTGLWGIESSPKIITTSGQTTGFVSSVWANGGGMTNTGGGTIPQAFGIYATIPTIGSTNYAIYANGASYINGSLTVSSTLTSSSIIVGSTTLISSSVALTNNAASAAGTLSNAPIAGNPTKWIPINDNGTTRNIPAW